jgi:hypothetical protein
MNMTNEFETSEHYTEGLNETDFKKINSFEQLIKLLYEMDNQYLEDTICLNGKVSRFFIFCIAKGYLKQCWLFDRNCNVIQIFDCYLLERISNIFNELQKIKGKNHDEKLNNYLQHITINRFFTIDVHLNNNIKKYTRYLFEGEFEKIKNEFLYFERRDIENFLKEIQVSWMEEIKVEKSEKYNEKVQNSDDVYNYLIDKLKETVNPEEFYKLVYSYREEFKISSVKFVTETLACAMFIEYLLSMEEEIETVKYTAQDQKNSSSDLILNIKGKEINVEVTVANFNGQSVKNDFLVGHEKGYYIPNNTVFKNGSLYVCEPIAQVVDPADIINCIKVAINKKKDKLKDRDILVISLYQSGTKLLFKDDFKEIYLEFDSIVDNCECLKGKRVIILFDKFVWDNKHPEDIKNLEELSKLPLKLLETAEKFQSIASYARLLRIRGSFQTMNQFSKSYT